MVKAGRREKTVFPPFREINRKALWTLCSSSNNYIKRTQNIFASIPLLSLIRKYYVDNDSPMRMKSIHDEGKDGSEWAEPDECFGGGRAIMSTTWQCTLFLLLCFHMFVITHTNFNWIHCDCFHVFCCLLYVPLSPGLARFFTPGIPWRKIWNFMIKLHTFGG